MLKEWDERALEAILDSSDHRAVGIGFTDPGFLSKRLQERNEQVNERAKVRLHCEVCKELGYNCSEVYRTYPDLFHTLNNIGS